MPPHAAVHGVACIQENTALADVDCSLDVASNLGEELLASLMDMTRRMTDHVVLYMCHSLSVWIGVLSHLAVAQQVVVLLLVNVRLMTGLPPPACRWPGPEGVWLLDYLLSNLTQQANSQQIVVELEAATIGSEAYLECSICLVI